ncbi:MAG: DUF2946 family protein [Pseudoxanthomonas sp.]
MLRLASLAVLLMVCAPLASRWRQSQPSVDGQPMCTAAGLQSLDGPAQSHAGHTVPSASAGESRGGPPTHADHGVDCDYCLLAARVLPVLAVALALPPALPAPAFANPDLLPPADAPRWLAHAPRGPPLTA